MNLKFPDNSQKALTTKKSILKTERWEDTLTTYFNRTRKASS